MKTLQNKKIFNQKYESKFKRIFKSMIKIAFIELAKLTVLRDGITGTRNIIEAENLASRGKCIDRFISIAFQGRNAWPSPNFICGKASEWVALRLETTVGIERIGWKLFNIVLNYGNNVLCDLFIGSNFATMTYSLGEIFLSGKSYMSLLTNPYTATGGLSFAL